MPRPGRCGLDVAEFGQRHSERRVREVLTRHHGDTGNLTRELVAARLLLRTRDGDSLRVDA